MLLVSNLLPQLAAIMPSIYALYGDPAYPQSVYLIGGVASASLQAEWNTAMSSGQSALNGLSFTVFV
jgi:hypothetical protein